MTIYLCGAINGCPDSECKDWRQYATLKLGHRYRILDPMRRDYRGIEDSSVAEIVGGDYDDIDHSDIVLAVADRPSWGTAMEIHQAFLQSKKTVVVCRNEKISPWLRYHASRIFGILDEAIEFLLKD